MRDRMATGRLQETGANAAARGWSGAALKYVAILAMIADHVAWSFLPKESAWGFALHVVGRITAPIMCFFVAEGYFRTRDVRRYALRLAVFALISHVPYNLHKSAGLEAWGTGTSVLYTLLLGLLALWAWDRLREPMLKFAAVAVACTLALPGDWSFVVVLWVVGFGAFRGDFRRQALAFLAVAALLWLPVVVAAMLGHYRGLYKFGVLLALPLLALYDGRRGSGGRFSKWVFYWFYPLHLAALAALDWMLGR